jgi:hypothetical protein
VAVATGKLFHFDGTLSFTTDDARPPRSASMENWPREGESDGSKTMMKGKNGCWAAKATCWRG